VECSEEAVVPVAEFTEELVGSVIMQNLGLCGFSRPTPVQKYSLPIVLQQSRDLMACAQTGSGKTGGFLLPVIRQLCQNGALEVPNLPGTHPDMCFPSCLILAPTRELAIQIFEESQKFTYTTGIRSVVVYGGDKMDRQMRELRRGCDMIIATPGRLIDFMDRGLVSLHNIQFLVLDEADRMLDMGFEPQIRKVVDESDMPSCAYRRTLMFSATFPDEIQVLSADFMSNYVFLAVGEVGSASSDVVQTVEWVEEREKNDRLRSFIEENQNPATFSSSSYIRPDINSEQVGLILVFVEKKRTADFLEHHLYRDGINAISIHGDKSQRDREDALKRFRRGQCPILIATDVASRGLDIPNVTHVINFDMPSNIDDYVHRIGRTGRVGNIGYATSFINTKNDNIFRQLYEQLQKHDQEIPPFFHDIIDSYRYYGKKGGKGKRGGSGGGRGRSNRFGATDVRRSGGNNRRYSNSSNGGSGSSGSNWDRGNSGYRNNNGGRGGGGRGGYRGRGGNNNNGGYNNRQNDYDF
jgi:ATP-dependent RNA helicase DDX3X